MKKIAYIVWDYTVVGGISRVAATLANEMCDFYENEVKRTWNDSRRLIYSNQLVWEYDYDKDGNRILNNSGSFQGAPNFPKSTDYKVFFRGGANDSRDDAKTECVNGIRMLPQFFWLKGSYIAEKLQTINYL